MSTDASPLPDDVALCHELIRQQADTIRLSQRKIEQLEHYLEQLLRRQFGPRRERLDPNQLALFEAAFEEGAEEESCGQVESKEEPASSRRKGGGRRRLPADLPRQRVEHQLPEAELPCPECGTQRHKIGEEISEQLEFVPASLYVIQHVRFKYACRSCQEHVVMAGKPAQPIDDCPDQACWPRRSPASIPITCRCIAWKTSLPATASSCPAAQCAPGWGGRPSFCDHSTT
jgi:transposase